MTESAKACIADKVGADRTKDDRIEVPVHFNKDQDGDNHNCNERSYDMPPELFEVIHKTHFSVLAPLV